MSSNSRRISELFLDSVIQSYYRSTSHDAKVLLIKKLNDARCICSPELRPLDLSGDLRMKYVLAPFKENDQDDLKYARARIVRCESMQGLCNVYSK